MFFSNVSPSQIPSSTQKSRLYPSHQQLSWQFLLYSFQINPPSPALPPLSLIQIISATEVASPLFPTGLLASTPTPITPLHAELSDKTRTSYPLLCKTNTLMPGRHSLQSELHHINQGSNCDSLPSLTSVCLLLVSPLCYELHDGCTATA